MKKFYWNGSVLQRSLILLSKNEIRKVFLVILLQIIIGLFDLIGVILIGLVGSLSIRGIQSEPPGDRVSKLLNFLRLENFSFQNQVAIIGLFACVVLVSKTLFSAFFTKKILFFLSARSAAISTRLISKLLTLDLIQIQKRTTQQTLFSVTTGVQAITVGILGSLVALISDISVLIFLIGGLFTVDFAMATLTLFLFGVVALVLFAMISRKAHTLGNRQSSLTISNNETILEVLNSYREAVVKNRRKFYADLIGKERFELSSTSAELAFIPNITKYVLEVTLILVALSMAALQFSTKNASLAMGILSIFFAAASRIAPAILRIQNGAVAIKSNIGIASTSLGLIEELYAIKEIKQKNEPIVFNYPDFIPSITFKNVSFQYSEESSYELFSLNLSINPGDFVVLAGPSGAGKSTIVDLMLGILRAKEGEILVSDIPISEALVKWPGAVAYVPQDSLIVNGSIAENVYLGYPKDIYDEQQVLKALEKAKLNDLISMSDDGIHTQVGERGSKISGGQRQRLGIARALFSNPKLLVLDEATSALDISTENKIYEMLKELKGETTVIMIAHRLSTIKMADKIFYIENGRITASGSFEEVRLQSKSFAKQIEFLKI